MEKTTSGKASEFICSTKYDDQVREDEMGMTCSTMANEKFIQHLLTSKRNRTFIREDNIVTDFK